MILRFYDFNPETAMALHPFREALGQAGLRAFDSDSPFKAVADEALARFKANHDDLEKQVRRGDLTVKVARAKAEAAAADLKTNLMRKADGYSPTPRAFLDRLVEAGNARSKARENLSAESLQRETNRLLRQSLVEQQLASRAAEFEGKTFARTFPGGKAGPTLQNLLDFNETAANAGDPAASEWARRQFEAMRTKVVDEADRKRIDLACDRPDAVNPRLVAGYMTALEGAEPDAHERFVSEATEGRDANACVASFLMARDAPGGPGLRWVRSVLSAIPEFPDAALTTLRSIEAEARKADTEAARAHAGYAVAVAEAGARFPGLEPPTEDDLARQARLTAKPVALLGQAIGLALDRRGFDPDAPESDLLSMLKPL